MKIKNISAVIFCSLLLSSCGLIEKFKTADTATPSNSENTSTTSLESTGPSDDLFATNNTETTATNDTHTDAPSNVAPVIAQQKEDDELKALQDDFTGNSPKESTVTEVKSEATPMEKTPEVDSEMPKAAPPKIAEKKKSTPLKIKEAAPVIDTDATEAKVSSNSTGEIKNYKVQKGETLMQIAFKLYGDISRWKELRKLNGDKLASNSSLKANLILKYAEPETPFVWNPEGNPYMIKNGETLGVISNNVYQTPKKWKTIWENNKPLIKNPNVIYAGFTLYYKDSGMANYVQPKKEQKKAVALNKNEKVVEEIKIEHALTEIEKLDAAEEIREIKSATVRAPASEEEEAIPDTSAPPVPTTDEGSEEEPIQ